LRACALRARASHAANSLFLPAFSSHLSHIALLHVPHFCHTSLPLVLLPACSLCTCRHALPAPSLASLPPPSLPPPFGFPLPPLHYWIFPRLWTELHAHMEPGLHTPAAQLRLPATALHVHYLITAAACHCHCHHHLPCLHCLPACLLVHATTTACHTPATHPATATTYHKFTTPMPPQSACLNWVLVSYCTAFGYMLVPFFSCHHQFLPATVRRDRLGGLGYTICYLPPPRTTCLEGIYRVLQQPAATTCIWFRPATICLTFYTTAGWHPLDRLFYFYHCLPPPPPPYHATTCLWTFSSCLPGFYFTFSIPLDDLPIPPSPPFSGHHHHHHHYLFLHYLPGTWLWINAYLPPPCVVLPLVWVDHLPQTTWNTTLFCFTTTAYRLEEITHLDCITLLHCHPHLPAHTPAPCLHGFYSSQVFTARSTHLLPSTLGSSAPWFTACGCTHYLPPATPLPYRCQDTRCLPACPATARFPVSHLGSPCTCLLRFHTAPPTRQHFCRS